MYNLLHKPVEKHTEMAKIQFKSYIKDVHGRMGNIIYYNVKGNQYARSYSIPRNPCTEIQQKNRSAFAEAVRLWHGLPPRKQKEYNRLAEGRPLSGYNIFISMQMNGVSLKLLMRVHRRQVPVREEPGGYTQEDTSISPPSLFAHGTLNYKKQSRMMKKPPGIAAQAA